MSFSFWPIINSILILGIIILFWYIRKKRIFYKNESAAYVHTEAIMSAIDEVPETLLVINTEGLIIYANSTLKSMFQYKESDLLERTIDKLIPTKYIPVIDKAKSENHREPFEIECLARDLKDGKPNFLPIEATVSVKKTNAGVANYTVILKDITHRKRNEITKSIAIERIKKECDLLCTGERIANTGVWKWDMTKRPDEVYYSPGFAELFDVMPNQILTAETLLESVFIDDLPSLKEAMQTCMETGKSYEVEYRISRRNGTKDLLHCKGQAEFSENNKPIILIGTIQLIKENVK